MPQDAPVELTNVRVSSMRVITDRDPLLMPSDGLTGAVEFDLDQRHHYFGVSRLDGETAWTVDAYFLDGAPRWSHGIGARYLRTTVITEPTLIEALDAAAEALTAEVPS